MGEEVDGASHEAAPGASRGGWRRWLRLTWIVVVAVAATVAIARGWDDVGRALVALAGPLLVAAIAAAVAAIGLNGIMWRQVVTGFGHRLPARAALEIFFVSQLSKYLPGSVWPVLTQIDLARDHGIAPRTSTAALVVFAWLYVVTGAAVGVALLAAIGLLEWWWWLLAVASLSLLTPGLLRRGVAWSLRRLRRPPIDQLPSARSVLAAAVASAGVWLLYGVHVWVLAAAVGGEIGLAQATGAFALAWVAGFLFIPAPAGAGARELVLIWGMLPALGSVGVGLVIAVASRLILTAADALWATAGLGARPREVVAMLRGGRRERPD